MALMSCCVPQLFVSPPISSQRRSACFVVRAAGKNESEQPVGAAKISDDERLRSGPFGFVTDNESSRTALQMPNEPWQDGNVGQMISEIKDKGRDYGSYIEVGEFRWFVRETGSRDARNGTILLLHGAPSQSYSYRNVMSQMADAGYRCIAPDWLGFGFSQAPQPGYRFSYTEDAYHEELDKVIAEMGVASPFILMTQGFVVGSYGLTWALKNPQRLSKLVILNTPLTASAPLPGLFNQMRIPLLGEFTCQNAMMAEKFIEKGSAYSLKLEKADVYRLPYLQSSGPGFAILEAVRKAPLQDLKMRISEGFSAAKQWKVPTLVAWGEEDKYLPVSEGSSFAAANPEVIRSRLVVGAGHMPQEDWPEKLVETISSFL